MVELGDFFELKEGLGMESETKKSVEVFEWSTRYKIIYLLLVVLVPDFFTPKIPDKIPNVL